MSLIVFKTIDAATLRPIGNVLLSSTGGPGPWQAMSDDCGTCITNLSPGDYVVTFSKAGLKDRIYPMTLADPGEIKVGLEPAVAPHLTRDQVCAVAMWFQGLRVTLPGYGTVPWFGPFINSLDASSRDVARAAERSSGTHCLRQLSYGYSEADYTYPIPPADFTNDLPTFRARLEEDRRAGLIPIVELAGDGQAYDPNGGTYGFTWLKANLARILDALGPVGDDCLFFHCWEAVNNGGWSPDNLFEMTLLHRQLRPNAHIAWHFSYAWPGDASGGQLGPIGEWSSPAGLACDVMLAEGGVPFVTEDGTPIPGDPLNGWQQRARCFLGPACNNAMIDPPNMEPYYWTVPTPRGPRVPVVFEIDLYNDVRGRLPLQLLTAERGYCRALGFPFVC